MAPVEYSKPEKMLYGWLIKHDVSFDFQSAFAGGRAVPGGAVLDFVIYDRPQPIVVRVQSYWHDSSEAHWHDAIQLNALQEFGYVVEDVWEYEINTVPKLDRKMRQILYSAPKFQEVV